MVFGIVRIQYPFSLLWSFPGFGIGFRKLCPVFGDVAFVKAFLVDSVQLSSVLFCQVRDIRVSDFIWTRCCIFSASSKCFVEFSISCPTQNYVHEVNVPVVINHTVNSHGAVEGVIVRCATLCPPMYFS